MNTKKFTILQALLITTIILSAFASFNIGRQIAQRGLLFSSTRWTLLFLAFNFGILLLIALLALTRTPFMHTLQGWLTVIGRFFSKTGRFNLAIFIVLSGLYPWLVMGPAGKLIRDASSRTLVFWLIVLAGCLFLSAYANHEKWGANLAITMSLYGLIHYIATFIPAISSNPFSLGWSEGSRYYYASLFFSESLYGVRLPLSAWHPSRYALQAIPFLIPGLPILFHRLWQVLLWLGMTALLLYSLARRLPLNKQSSRWIFMFFTWGFLYLFQGPVYYHLVPCAVLIFWGFDRQKFWRSLIIIVLASAWAGISRINWVPMPAFLAIGLYLLEEPIQSRSLWSYLQKPFAWGVAGITTAFLSYSLYIWLSGNPTEQFGSSFTSDLLWYRLLPSPTYGPGILPGILGVTAPLWVLVVSRLRSAWRAHHPVRYLAMAVIFLVMFGGGLLVSVKIGGGSNLHNLDGYLVLTMLAGSYVFFGKFAPDSPTSRDAPPPRWQLTLIILVVPIWVAIQSGVQVSAPSSEEIRTILNEIQQLSLDAASHGKEVLFISQRQLMVFDDIQGIPFTPEYENITLMEMAMAGNQAYLEQFIRDIETQRFGLIISHKNTTDLRGRAASFGEENDVWVQKVAIPLLAHYQVHQFYKSVGVEILEPNP